jgi:hypothetical protein
VADRRWVSCYQGLDAGPGRYHPYVRTVPVCLLFIRRLLARGYLLKEWFILCERVEGGGGDEGRRKGRPKGTYVKVRTSLALIVDTFDSRYSLRRSNGTAGVWQRNFQPGRQTIGLPRYRL